MTIGIDPPFAAPCYLRAILDIHVLPKISQPNHPDAVIDELVRHKLVYYNPDRDAFATTERGGAWIEALIKTPLPIQITKWVQPSQILKQ